MLFRVKEIVKDEHQSLNCLLTAECMFLHGLKLLKDNLSFKMRPKGTEMSNNSMRMLDALDLFQEACA